MKRGANYVEVIEAHVPQSTRSYQAISNYNLIEAVREELDKRSLIVKSEHYDMNSTRTQLFGVMNIGANDSNFQMNLGFRNSYDKSLALGFVAGSTVIVCSNLMFKGDVKILRKHTSGVKRDFLELLRKSVDVVDVEFEEVLKDADKMKQIEVPKRKMAQIAGNMFINENLINSNQMSVIKREINESENFPLPSMWDFYNHVTESLKLSHPAERMQSHIRAHNYILDIID